MGDASVNSDGQGQIQTSAGVQQPALTAFLPYLKAAKYADAVLKIKTTDNKINTVPVHRVLLSYRSPFFEDLFSQTLPTETNSKGLPMYPLPVLPSHKALHEVLDSMEDNEISIPESKWDQIVGVRHVAEIFELPRLHSYSDRVLKASIEAPTTNPDDIFTIADEASKWGVRDIENLAIDRLVELLAANDTDDETLSISSFQTFAAVMDHTDPTKHFALVRRYISARSRPQLVLPSEQATALWHRVPFQNLTIDDIESAFVDNNVPISLVLDTASSKIVSDSSALLNASFDLFFATVDHATADIADVAPSPLFVPWPANQTYQMVRAYIHHNADLDASQREDLWSKVRLEDLTLDELEEANRDGSAPRNALVTALFAKLRTPGPSSSSGGGAGGLSGLQSLQARPSIASFQTGTSSSNRSTPPLPSQTSLNRNSQPSGPYTLGPQPVIDTHVDLGSWGVPGDGSIDNSDVQSTVTATSPQMSGAASINGSTAPSPPPHQQKKAGIQRFFRDGVVG
ncbi:hypothetical protein HDU93_009543 [Gonapodya sp. JEL0774]|nr:hypothetical protein HDU93_009543 [Gonapodya sp. JEL0774]